MFDPAPAAALLAQCWRDGTQIAELPPTLRPATLTQGYDAQDAVIDSLPGRSIARASR